MKIVIGMLLSFLPILFGNHISKEQQTDGASYKSIIGLV